MELSPQRHPQYRASLTPHQDSRNGSPRSRPILSSPRFRERQDNLNGGLVDWRRWSIDDHSQTVVDSANGSLHWKEDKLAYSRDEASETAVHHNRNKSSETSSHRQSRRMRCSTSSRSSVPNSGHHQDRNLTLEADSFNQQYKHEIAHVPSAILEDFQALRRNRTRMSYHWTRYREQYSYVRQESNVIASTVAAMNQELERNPPGSLYFGASWHRLKLLASRIQTQHADLAISEAQLDEVGEQMLIQEQELRSVERRLGLHLNLDDTSDDSDMLDLEELLNHKTSLPATPRPGSSSVSDDAATQMSHHQKEDNFQRELTNLDENVIYLDNPDAALSLEVDQTPQRVTVLPSLATLTESIVRQDTIVEHTGAQFAPDEQISGGGIHTPESELRASPLQSQKRTMDLNTRDFVRKVSTKNEDVELELGRYGAITDIGPSMIDRMLHVVRSSWLEFSAIVHVLEQQWGFVKTYDIFKIDTLLRQNIYSSDVSQLHRAVSTGTVTKISSTTQKRDHSSSQASIKQDSASGQPTRHRAKAQSLGGRSNTNRQARDPVIGKQPDLLYKIVIALPGSPDDQAQTSEPSQASYNGFRSHSLPIPTGKSVIYPRFNVSD